MLSPICLTIEGIRYYKAAVAAEKNSDFCMSGCERIAECDWVRWPLLCQVLILLQAYGVSPCQTCFRLGACGSMQLIPCVESHNCHKVQKRPLTTKAPSPAALCSAAVFPSNCASVRGPLILSVRRIYIICRVCELSLFFFPCRFTPQISATAGLGQVRIST